MNHIPRAAHEPQLPSIAMAGELMGDPGYISILCRKCNGSWYVFQKEIIPKGYFAMKHEAGECPNAGQVLSGTTDESRLEVIPAGWGFEERRVYKFEFDEPEVMVENNG